MEKNNPYSVIIGLEIHLRLATKSKMFCGSANNDVETPNQNVCPICLGHPGTLPQVNAAALKLGILLARALNCEVKQTTQFDRKNYFYPDLPKGYQISQYKAPLAEHGYLDILYDDIHTQRCHIERLHLEEDAAKLKHDHKENSLVDFNRAGAPLAEIVTSPEIRSPLEAKLFLQELQQVARYVRASQANMEKGELRVDANISLRPMGDEALYPKTEIKNMNSFRAVERALTYEIQRQTELWQKNQAPEQTTTRGWDDSKGITIEQRVKEGEADYRYFPEPDLPPIVCTTQEIEQIRQELPELPIARRQRFQSEFELNYHDAKILTADPLIADFFEETISELRAWLDSLDDTAGSDEEIWQKYRKKIGRLTTAWITTELFKLLNENAVDFAGLRISPENMAELLTMVYERKVNSTAAQKILKIMFDTGGDPSMIMAEHDLGQVSDSGEIEHVVEKIIKTNDQVVQDYKAGKEKALMFLVGQVMKETKGKVNPEIATALLKERLK